MLCDMVSENAFIRNITLDICLICDPNIEFKGSLEPLRLGVSNEHPKPMF